MNVALEHTSVSLSRRLSLHALAGVARAPLVEGDLERVAFPAEEVVAVPAVAGPNVINRR